MAILLPVSATSYHPPDVIYHNGVVLTMEEGTPRAEAVAIRAGRILAVGDDEHVLPLRRSTTRVVDLDGRFLEHQPRHAYSPHLRLAGIKLFLDHDWGTVFHWDQAELTEYVLTAHRNGWQVTAHTVSAKALNRLYRGRRVGAEPHPADAGATGSRACRVCMPGPSARRRGP